MSSSPNRRGSFPRFAALVLATIILMVGGVTAHAARLSNISPDALRPLLSESGKIRLTRIPLADGAIGTLQLERFEVFAPDATIVVHGADGSVRHDALPKTRFYRGSVEGQADSLAFIASNGDDVSGLVLVGERRFALGKNRAGKGGRPLHDVVVEEVEVSDDLSDGLGQISCEIDHGPIAPSLTARVASDAAPVEAQALNSASAMYTLNLIIETDYEFFQKLGSANAVTNNIASLLGAGSTIYQRDLRTSLQLQTLHVYTTAADPWTKVPGAGASSLDALFELGDYYHANYLNTPRSAVMLLSGKDQSAGIAWLGQTCNGDFLSSGHYGGAYGFAGGAASATVANPNTNPGSSYGPLLLFTHELGHIAGSSHTHCMSLSAAQQNTYGVARAYVDTCYNGEGGCYSGASSLPQPEGRGTIMSYCHLLNFPPMTSWSFGTPGKPSELVLNAMTSEIGSSSPNMSAISAPANVTAGVPAQASVGAIAGATYAWTITNGVINSGSTTNAITFTATSSPVTLGVQVRNARLCGVQDSVQIAVAAGSGGTLPDSNGDGFADLLWRNYSTGANAWWYLTPNGALSGSALLPGVADTNWRIESVNDFTDDGKVDLVWRNYSTGTVAIWQMNGTAVANSFPFPAVADLNWKIVGSGDFNNDGKNDLVWRHAVNGGNAVWLLNNTTYTGSAALPGLADTNWQIVTVNDFNDDNRPDLMWRNSATGQNAIWAMNGTAYSTSYNVAGVADSNWKIAGSGDFSGDGNPDLVWRNTATGANACWVLGANGAVSTTFPFPSNGDLNWQIAGPR